jgi:hypothetical protein
MKDELKAKLVFARLAAELEFVRFGNKFTIIQPAGK